LASDFCFVSTRFHCEMSAWASLPGPESAPADPMESAEAAATATTLSFNL